MTFLLMALAVLLQGAVPQATLEGEALGFARAWERGETRILEGVMAENGIRLNLPGEQHILIRPRQARAALDVFFKGYMGGEAEITRVSLTGGDPEKGFAEIQWRTGSLDVAEPVVFTLFLAYAFENEAWAVTEIRVLF